MTVGGIPSVYYGDELGLTGTKEQRLGGDDAVRPEFGEQPGPPSPEAARMLDAHRALIGLRRRHPWLVTATTTTLALENTRFGYRVAARDGDEHLDVELDLGAGPEGGCSATVRDADGALLWQYPVG